MDIGTISKHYAKALMAYAREEGAEEVVYKEMRIFARSSFEVPQLRIALQNPVLPAEEKQKLIFTAAVGEAEPSAVFARFVGMVVQNKREEFLLLMAFIYMRLYFKLKHIAAGRLITAVPVDVKTRKRIKEAAAAYVHAKMRLETVVDPSIEGGFIFDINGYRLDASVATQLKRVKQQFIDKNKRIV